MMQTAHIRRDWARPFHFCTETGLAAAPLPRLRRDWADSPQQSSLGPRRGGSGPIEEKIPPGMVSYGLLLHAVAG
jgi:hypothetical protein